MVRGINARKNVGDAKFVIFPVDGEPTTMVQQLNSICSSLKEMDISFHLAYHYDSKDIGKGTVKIYIFSQLVRT